MLSCRPIGSSVYIYCTLARCIVSLFPQEEARVSHAACQLGECPGCTIAGTPDFSRTRAANYLDTALGTFSAPLFDLMFTPFKFIAGELGSTGIQTFRFPVLCALVVSKSCALEYYYIFIFPYFKHCSTIPLFPYFQNSSTPRHFYTFTPAYSQIPMFNIPFSETARKVQPPFRRLDRGKRGSR